MRYRVFGTNECEPDPAELQGILRVPGRRLEVQSQSDSRGWYRAQFWMDDEVAVVERYLADEEGIREELLTWAAWVESAIEGEVQQRLMQGLISTRQVFVMRDPGWNLGNFLCRQFARETEGVYQIDGQGFFDAAGELLAADETED